MRRWDRDWRWRWTCAHGMEGREEGRGHVFCPHVDGSFVILDKRKIRGRRVAVERVLVIQKPLRAGNWRYAWILVQMCVSLLSIGSSRVMSWKPSRRNDWIFRPSYSSKQHRSSCCEAAYCQMHSLKCICQSLRGFTADYTFDRAVHLGGHDMVSQSIFRSCRDSDIGKELKTIRK